MQELQELPFTGIAYKYVSSEGAKKIIANRSLRFACPSQMNDPFDVAIEELFDSELEVFLERTKSWFIDSFMSNPMPYLVKKFQDSRHLLRRVTIAGKFSSCKN